MAARFAAIIVGTKVYGNADLQHVARPLPETFAVDLGVMRLDWPSFGLGLIVAAIWQLLRRRKSRWRMLAKVLMVAALVAAAAGSYFGWLHRIGGNSANAFASPLQIVDDAKQTVKQMQVQSAAQQDALDALEPGSAPRSKSSSLHRFSTSD